MGRVVFVPDRSQDSPVARLRAHGFAAELARRGYETLVIDNPVPVRWDSESDLARPLALGVISLMRQLKQLRKGDVLYLVRIQQLPIFPYYAVARARAIGARVVYDFDDAVYLEQPVTTRYLARAADRVVISGQGHVAFAQRWARAYTIAPTPFDPAEYPEPLPDASAQVVGWMGTPSNLHHLRPLRGVLEELIASGVTFRVITRVSDAARAHLPEGTELIPWRIEDYRQEMAKFHVGIAPVGRTAWTEGKLGYKAIEYQACGVPTIASPVMEKDEVIAPGETGYYAEGPSDWHDRLQDLLRDRTRRDKMASRAKAHVEARFSIRVAGDKLEGALAGLIDAPHRSRST